MIGLIIVLGIILIFFSVVAYFFCIAFIRKSIGDCDDVNAPCNKVLGDFRSIVGESICRVKKIKYKRVETVSFDGLKLSAGYFNNNYKNTVILFHGYRSSAFRDMSCAVEMYSSLGFNVLLVDQRSHGNSEGKLITFGVKEKYDVLSWIDFVCDEYSPEKIILGGLSMGATTVLLAAGEGLPENVKAVIADCGYTSPEEIIKGVAKRYFKINATVFLPFLDLFCRIFGKFSIRNASTEESLKNSQIPILLVHGEEDDIVPCEMSQRAIKSCNADSCLLTVEKASHGMSFLVDRDKVLNKITEFLTKCGCLQ